MLFQIDSKAKAIKPTARALSEALYLIKMIFRYIKTPLRFPL